MNHAHKAAQAALLVMACLLLAVSCQPVPETPDFQPELGRYMSKEVAHDYT